MGTEPCHCFLGLEAKSAKMNPKRLTMIHHLCVEQLMENHVVNYTLWRAD